MAEHSAFDFIAATVTEDMPYVQNMFISELNDQINGFIDVKKRSKKGFLVIFTNRPLGITHMDDWRWRAFAEARTRLVNEWVATFTDVAEAAKAVRELIYYYKRQLYPVSK